MHVTRQSFVGFFLISVKDHLLQTLIFQLQVLRLKSSSPLRKPCSPSHLGEGQALEAQEKPTGGMGPVLQRPGSCPRSPREAAV